MLSLEDKGNLPSTCNYMYMYMYYYVMRIAYIQTVKSVISQVGAHERLMYVACHFVLQYM